PILFSSFITFFLSHHILSFPSFFFFFNDTATTEIYTLSLHDALPISARGHWHRQYRIGWRRRNPAMDGELGTVLKTYREVRHGADRKSTRLNSSHVAISYAVFCLKKKKKKKKKKKQARKQM